MGFPFKELGSILIELETRYDRINWGGCGIVAAMIARHLTPFVDDMRIVTHGHNVEEARNNTEGNSIRDWENTGAVDFRHVWVEFKIGWRWYCIDSEGIRSRRKMYDMWGSPAKGSFSIQEIHELSKNPSGWNSAFNREQVPSIKSIFGRRFNEIFYDYI